MFKKVVFILLLAIISYRVGFAQESQSDIISSANLKFNQMDESIKKEDVSKILELQKEILLLTDSLDSLEDQETRFLIYNIAINKLFAAKCYKDAIALSVYSLDKARRFFGLKHKEVAEFLRLLGFSYAHDGQILKAIEYGKQSVQMFEDLKETDSESYLMAVILLNQYYGENHQYPESIEMLRKCLNLIDLEKIPSESLITIYRAVAASYSELNNFIMAQAYTIKALNLYKDKSSVNYLGLKQNLAWFYSNNGNHEEAMQTINDVCDTLKMYGDSYVYALALCDKASIYIHTQNFNKQLEAIQYAIQSSKIFENANDTLSNKYVHSLMTQAEAYRSIDLFDRTQAIYKKVYQLQKQFLDTANIDDIETLSISAVLANNLQEGLFYFQRLEKQILQEKGENSIDYANAKYLLSELYYIIHDYDSAIINIKDALPLIRNCLAKTFFMLEDKERMEFWNKYINMCNESLPRMCYNSSNSKFSELMYDASLLSKGLLLNAEREKRMLMQGDISVDDFIKPFFLNWRDVQSQLKDDDIAIEFIKVCPYKDMPVYVVATIRQLYESPRLTTICIEEELRNVSDTLFYQCEDMSNLVWEPLQAELQGIKNIYFSPAGALYNIGIEYLPGMEDYNIYRLSSTRELVTNKRTDTNNHAVLYGGLDYYASLNESHTTLTRDNVYVEHANVRSMGLRGGKESLPQTQIEVEKIGEELSKNQWAYNLLTGTDGTEESFKALSGKKVNCLHISTHGFYYTPEEVEETGYDFLQFKNEMASIEDKSLTRSGLIMSGANHILEGELLPENVEDGILTAKEIADVDLRGLDLVVLSACQTGLGDISQGEGVFGLQRGFKKAGANSILMSLWEVDDNATQILMTQFYRNLLTGQSKRQSLLSAQDYLRKIEDGKYNEPKYWAAFILLDGIN